VSAAACLGEAAARQRRRRTTKKKKSWSAMRTRGGVAVPTAARWYLKAGTGKGNRSLVGNPFNFNFSAGRAQFKQ
jgi:hypothetical protein